MSQSLESQQFNWANQTRKFLTGVGFLMAPFLADSAEIYLCESYGGGMFWASDYCNKHKALIKKIVPVPESMSFKQQVELAEQQQRPANANSVTRTTTTTTTTSSYNPAAAKAAECQALEARIVNFDGMARQPQTGQMQDWISAQKRKSMDRQFANKC